MSEYWKDLQRAINENEAARLKAQQDARNAQLAADARREAQERDRARIESERRRQEQELVAKATSIMTQILEEARRNHPSIRQARMSQVEGLTLKWGDKLGLTASEREILEKYRYQKGSFLGIGAPRLPDQIIGEDYFSIHASVGANSVYINGSLSTVNFVANPRLIMPNIASALLSPSHTQRTYRKGSDYWIRSSSDSDLFPSYEQKDCCCS